jgi:hypothetical protein
MTKEKRTMPKRRLFRFLSLSCAYVANFTINRTKPESEIDEPYAYSMTCTGKSTHEDSLASYHNPTDIPFQAEIKWHEVSKPESGNTGVIGPFEVRFSRAQHYKVNHSSPCRAAV